MSSLLTMRRVCQGIMYAYMQPNICMRFRRGMHLVRRALCPYAATPVMVSLVDDTTFCQMDTQRFMNMQRLVVSRQPVIMSANASAQSKDGVRGTELYVDFQSRVTTHLQ